MLRFNIITFPQERKKLLFRCKNTSEPAYFEDFFFKGVMANSSTLQIERIIFVIIKFNKVSSYFVSLYYKNESLIIDECNF